MEVPLSGGLGQYVKLELKFSGTWLLLSEVTFSSGQYLLQFVL